MPPGFQQFLGQARWDEAGRRLINRLWLRLPSVMKTLRAASVLFVSNRTTRDFLPQACQAKSVIVPPNALRPEDEAYARSSRSRKAVEDGKFRLLYVGNCVATRCVPLVLEALRVPALGTVEFTVIGDGPALPEWKRMAQGQGLADRVRFLGKIPHAGLADYYDRADALVFPALRDSGGSALLEAMARGVPIVCFDWAGPGEMVDEQSGLKVPVTTPDETVAALSGAIRRLAADPALGPRLAEAARERAAASFRWEAKRQLLLSTYQRLITS